MIIMIDWSNTTIESIDSSNATLLSERIIERSFPEAQNRVSIVQGVEYQYKIHNTSVTLFLARRKTRIKVENNNEQTIPEKAGKVIKFLFDNPEYFGDAVDINEQVFWTRTGWWDTSNSVNVLRKVFTGTPINIISEGTRLKHELKYISGWNFEILTKDIKDQLPSLLDIDS